MSVRAVLCHRRQHLEPDCQEALRVLVGKHLMWVHSSIPPKDEQVQKIVSTRAHNLQPAEVYLGRDAMAEDFGLEPYWALLK